VGATTPETITAPASWAIIALFVLGREPAMIVPLKKVKASMMNAIHDRAHRQREA
jgi:hypothetical protein